MSDDKTMKLVTNLERPAIEAKLHEVGAAAAAAGMTELAKMFIGVEGMPRAQIEQRVTNAQKWLAGKGHGAIASMLDLVEMNLKNLK